MIKRTTLNVLKIGGIASVFVVGFFAVSVASVGAVTSPTIVNQAGQFRAQVTSLNVEDKNDFVVEPGKMEVVVDPGQSVTKNISITSRIKKATKFAVSAEDFQGSQTEQQPVVLLGDKNSPWSFKDNIVPAENQFELGFGDRIDLPVTITVPKDTAPGGYFTAVVVSNQPQVDADLVVSQATTRIISRVAVLFFIKVNGPTSPDGYTEDFRVATPHFIYPASPEAFKILFNNKGNQYLVPFGTIHVANMFGRGISDIPVNAYFSLPDSLRYLTVAWGDTGFRFGRYTATLQLNRGYGGLIDTRTIAFWVLPWKVLAPLLGGIIVVLILLYFIFSRFEFRRKK